MRKIIVHEFISLDGIIQAPGKPDEDTEGGFNQGGWTMPYWHEEIGKQFNDTFKNADALLLGRKTWQTHATSFEPMTGDPFADVMNAMQKFVVSKTLKSASAWRNSTLIKDNVIEEVKKLKKQKGKNILIDGSSVLIKTLIENNLIDEYELHVYPLVLGNGKRLFSVDKRLDFKLVKTMPLPTGVVYIKYQSIEGGGIK